MHACCACVGSPWVGASSCRAVPARCVPLPCVQLGGDGGDVGIDRPAGDDRIGPLGMGGGERKSFKDVKSYKRRKRWLA